MKLKSHKGLSKRVRKTKTGKIKRRSAHISHLLVKKNATKRRRHAGYFDISKSDKKQVKKLVPY